MRKFVITEKQVDLLMGQATTRPIDIMLRTLPELGEPVMRLNDDSVPEWLPPNWGGSRMPGTLLYTLKETK
jgi:hypothetical protein